MARLPLQSYSLTADWERAGDLARAEDVNAHPAAERVSIPITEERLRIRRFDATDAVEDLFLTFVYRDGAWYVAADDDLTDLGLQSARHLWDFGPLYSVRSRHFLLFGHPCGDPGAPKQDCESLSKDFLRLAEQALERVDNYWTKIWPNKVVVLVPGTARELTRMLQLTFDVSNFVAFAYSSVDDTKGIDYTAPRIVFNHRSLTTRSESSVLGILAHELLHVATRYSSGPFVPTFIEEGLADYVGEDADINALAFLSSEIRAGFFDRVLPKDFEFTIGSGTEIFRSYQESHSAVRFFVQRWGLDRFVRLYLNLGRRDVRAGTARYHLHDAMKDVIGIGLKRFQALWADSLSPS